MKRIILFNGPPGCGKDTLASLLVPYIKFSHLKFAAPIKRMVAGALDMTLSGLEDNKDTRARMLQRRDTMTEDGQDTLRALLIALSEEFMKPRYGDDVFGRLFWNDAKNHSSDCIIATDCGFRSEVQTVVQRAGKANCLIIRIHRDGCTFENDSRSYLPDNLCDVRDLDNNRDHHFLLAAGLRLITQQFAEIKQEREIEWVKVR